MSLWSAVGGAVAGAGAAAASIGNQYIDQEIQMQKAQALADIHRANLGGIRADEDAFRNDPNRVARDRANSVANIEAEGGARNKVALAGKLAEAGSTELTAAQVAREKAALEGLTPAKIAAEKAVIEGLTPVKVAAEKAEIEGTMGAKAKAAGLMARATDMNGGLRAMQAELLGMDLKDKKRLGTLYDEYLAVTNDPNTPAADKAAKLAPISNAIQAIKAKNGQSAARDPELDTQTVTEERMNPDGTVTKTQRKEVRRPSQSASADSGDTIKAAMDAARAKARPQPTAASAPRSLASAAAKPPGDPIVRLDEGTLRRIAAIRGHADQAKAQAELDRREAARPDVDTSGIGFGG